MDEKALNEEMTRFKRVEVPLVGEDGNAFAIMGRVRNALKRAGYPNIAEKYIQEATSGNYDNLLMVSMKYTKDTENDEDEYEDEYEEE
jgi:hypothetical protein